MDWRKLVLPVKIDLVEEKFSFLKYTDILYNAQKKTSLENSLLQDIPILNGNDSSQLEDWLTDIETVSELMGKSRTQLAQAKSRGLVKTLILEALTFPKLGRELKTLST